jgi:hypothetical protein
VANRPLALSARVAELEKGERVSALEKTVAQLVLDAATRDRLDAERDQKAKETHDMVKALSDALLKAQPGHDKPLLDRVAAVTIRVERGEWSIKTLAWLAGLVVVIGGAATALTKWGGGT